ncbi:hypothetical protein BPA30113_03833 [Burkholderia paludis]|uniref:Uncharacterized protein n=1 Tax=Burkholderia paludis TaxID=1506587 RepID=A0A6J5EER7_9BURK|nr:hypothetical protein LMG30113_04636 [Burkholderia paludis]VWB83304.1 hypothetical protein BPA30113_03833 [Burkholderia paludis]
MTGGSERPPVLVVDAHPIVAHAIGNVGATLSAASVWKCFSESVGMRDFMAASERLDAVQRCVSRSVIASCKNAYKRKQSAPALHLKSDQLFST